MKRKKVSGTEWQTGLLVVMHRKRQGFLGKFRGRAFFDLRLRVGLVWILFWGIAGVIFSRLLYLQVFEGGRNLLLAQSNRILVEREYAPRGVIYDRNGEMLVRNVPAIKKFSTGEEVEIVTRWYALGEAAAHVVGYISEVVESEIGCYGGLCYEQGMLVGRYGVEKVFESTLRGRDGGRLVEVDSSGNEVREIGRHDFELGSDVTLSIDLRLQKYMYSALEGRKGSVVMIDMQGKVLGMVSSPSFDPNLFTVDRDGEGKLQELLEDSENQPFLNRAMGGAYPPGSIYKLVTAHAGLNNGAIDIDTLIEDTGEIRIGSEYRFGNWYFDQYGKTEGEIGIIRAIARSNDIFFYKTGEMVGVDGLVEWSRKFGLGQETGIEIEGEVEGLVPDRLWRERFTGERWFLGNTYHMAIGQGDLMTTPLQIARMALASISGRLCSLSVVKDSAVVCKDLGIETEVLEIVREGMKQACASGGTAFPLFDFSPYVICKTGTAQHGDEEEDPHAWIVVGYPGENPEVVLVVMLESAGEGSYEAGPVARRILEEWKGM